MTITILLPLLVALVGMLVYALAANPKVAELARLAYFSGLLITLFELATQVLHL